jgi:hypothetical protein
LELNEPWSVSDDGKWVFQAILSAIAGILLAFFVVDVVWKLFEIGEI